MYKISDTFVIKNVEKIVYIYDMHMHTCIMHI